jgi:hypothetical protein
VVACAGGDDASAALVWGELGDEVDTSSDLEGACRVVVLVFDVGLSAEEVIEEGIGVERCA